MKKIIFIIFSGLLLLAGCGGNLAVEENKPDDKKGDNMVEITSQLEIKSPVFGSGEKIPSKYTCDGEDVSPPLKISGVAGGTKSLALIVDDPDAPGGDWVHWLVWNIMSEIGEIKEGVVPEGAVQGKTSFGATEYGGPCPPSGTHRYFFKLYALDTTLDLDARADKGQLLEAMKGHVIAEAELMGKYARN